MKVKHTDIKDSSVSKKDFGVIVGEKIASIRKKKCLTQSELARRCHKDRQAIERIEKGRVSPNSYTLYELSKALDIAVSKLLEFNDVAI